MSSRPALLLALLVTALPAPAQRLSSLERRLGWSAPFADDSFAGWRLLSDESAEIEGWSVRSGVLQLEPGSGDLVSRERFEDLELAFDWRVSEGANSGVKVRVYDREALLPLGPEYQVLDDVAHPEIAPRHSAAALYDLEAPAGKELVPTGSWNRARIVARGARLEHADPTPAALGGGGGVDPRRCGRALGGVGRGAMGGRDLLDARLVQATALDRAHGVSGRHAAPTVFGSGQPLPFDLRRVRVECPAARHGVRGGLGPGPVRAR